MEISRIENEDSELKTSVFFADSKKKIKIIV